MASFNEIQQKILKLKKEKNAIILAHYYVPLEVQDVADVVGDSFEMAKRAATADADVIVVCGVTFMGESAKILSPNKKVLLPSMDAGCYMAEMITPEQVLEYKEQHPDAAVMCYVNSSAAVKAVSDVCCTSSSALRIAKALPNDEIIFIPDQHLGDFTAANVPDKKFYIHKGFCPTHHRIVEKDVLAAKNAHPDAVFAAHPECRDEVLKHADYIGSTSGILDYVRTSDAREVLIGTEIEIVERLRRECPQKNIYSIGSTFTCVNMKKINAEALLNCLASEQYEVTLPEDELKAARACLDRMVNM
ncbi:MAG: quinolinate synthase NadA [Oscillospiraceae bacterium]